MDRECKVSLDEILDLEDQKGALLREIKALEMILYWKNIKNQEL